MNQEWTPRVLRTAEKNMICSYSFLIVKNDLKSKCTEWLLVEFMYLVFARMPGESYRRRLRSLVYLCYVSRAQINSLCLLIRSKIDKIDQTDFTGYHAVHDVWCCGGPVLLQTIWRTTLTIITTPALTRPGNCGTCSAGQVIRATLSVTHPWSGWSSAVWFQPSHWAQSTPSSGLGWKNPTWLRWGFEPTTLYRSLRK